MLATDWQITFNPDEIENSIFKWPLLFAVRSEHSFMNPCMDIFKPCGLFFLTLSKKLWIWLSVKIINNKFRESTAEIVHFIISLAPAPLAPLVEYQTSQQFKCWICHDFIALSALLKQKKTYQKVKSEWCNWIPLSVTVIYTRVEIVMKSSNLIKF